MKFHFQYRTSKNELKYGSIDAVDRDSAYALLRKDGIRPSRLVEAPGLLNKILGKGKRWIAIAVLVVLLCVSLGVILLQHEEVERLDELHPMSRCQIYGDPALISEGLASKWGNVFSSECDRFLALYAQPGKPIVVQPTSEVIEDAKDAINRRTEYSADDSEEVKKLKCIVEGMKLEAREYVGDGGRIDVYLKRVVARELQEFEYYASTKVQLEGMLKAGTFSQSEIANFWATRNDKLRAMGIEPIPMPQSLYEGSGNEF